MKTPRLFRLVLLALAAMPAIGGAHTLGASYLTVDSEPGQNEVTAQWEIALGDLHALLDLDGNDDGLVTARELAQTDRRLEEQVLPELLLSRGDAPCRMAMRDLLVNRRSDGFYAVLMIEGDCAVTGPLGIEYRLLFDIDRSHRALLRVREGTRASALVLTPDAPRWRDTSASRLSTVRSFLLQGVHHIWIGYDHIAFLLLLLLPVVLRTHSGQWQAAPRLSDVGRRIVGIVTAFTLAHSLTLSLAALNVLAPPEQPIEIAIAGSVVAAGLMNLVPHRARYATWIAFGFGLVHGFGFANVLRELALPRDALAIGLAAFNVGVELGQLAIVALLLPLIYPVRAAAFYRLRFVPAASLAASILALGWLLERAI